MSRALSTFNRPQYFGKKYIAVGLRKLRYPIKYNAALESAQATRRLWIEEESFM